MTVENISKEESKKSNEDLEKEKLEIANKLRALLKQREKENEENKSEHDDTLEITLNLLDEETTKSV